MNNDFIIEVKDHCLMTPDLRVLVETLSFNIKRGEVFCIEGVNGSGKTTLLNSLISSSSSSHSGIIVHVPKDKIYYVPQLQDSELHIPMTVRDTIKIAFEKDISDDEIVSIGLLSHEHLNYLWNKASGGEKRRALLSKAFLSQPDLLVLDEPFNHLDQISSDSIKKQFKKFLSHPQKSMILVTHDPLDADILSNISHQILKL